MPLAIFALAVPLITGLAVLVSGFGLAWDFLNYHYYDGYALFHDRSHDIAPAGLHTYFNPTVEIPFYLGASYLPMPLFGFLFGLFSGLNFPLVYFLCRKVLQGSNASLLALLCAIFAVTSANFAIELASVNHDNLVSLFFIGGLLPLFYASQASRPYLLVAIAGLLIGLGAGLKLTLMPFLVGTGVCLPLLFYDRMGLRPMLGVAAIFAFAALAGVLATSAWWMLHLWEQFGNPLFPMFNTVFHSPYALAASYADHRFLPRGVLEWIAYPLFFTFDFHKAGLNMPVQDYRYLLAYVGFLLAGVVVVVRHLRYAPVNAGCSDLMEPNAAWFLIAMAVVAYVLWEITFGVSRYLFPLDLLLPLVALAWLQVLRWTSWRAGAIWAVVFAMLVVTTNHPWRGQHPWNERLMSVRVPAIPNDAMVIMAGSAPLAYLIPGFPPHVPFVRISLEDGFSPAAPGGITALDSPALLAKQARDAIAAHKGSLFVLYSHIRRKEAFESAVVATTLERLHLSMMSGSCKPVVPDLHYVDQTYALCALHRS